MSNRGDYASKLEGLRVDKDNAYKERDLLVAALSKIYPSWLERHPAEDESWEDDWRWIVFIVVPGTEKIWEWYEKSQGAGHYVHKERQMSWHIHESELKNFTHLKFKHGSSWDGHTTEEKYERLSTIKPKGKL